MCYSTQNPISYDFLLYHKTSRRPLNVIFANFWSFCVYSQCSFCLSKTSHGQLLNIVRTTQWRNRHYITLYFTSLWVGRTVQMSLYSPQKKRSLNKSYSVGTGRITAFQRCASYIQNDILFFHNFEKYQNFCIFFQKLQKR